MGDEPYAPRVFKDALDHALISNVKETAEALSHCSNYWIPRDVIESGHGATPTECAVAALLDLVSPSLPQDWAGAEYWVQIYESGRGLAFHFDKDEHAMKEDGRMVNPILSSVLYLTGGGGGGGAFVTEEAETSSETTETAYNLSPHVLRVQAPTVVNNQLYDQEKRCTVPDDPTTSTFIFPRENSYCVFDGRLGHGVLDSACMEERITLLINWWQVKPENIDRIEITPTDEVNNSEAVENLKSSMSASEERKLPECIYPETMEFVESDLGENAIELVDEYFKVYKKSLTGKDAMHAVTINHPGFCLYTVEAGQLIGLEEDNKDKNIVLHVGAGIGPIYHVPSSSSSSSSSSSDEE